MKKILFLAAAVATLLTSCSNDDVSDVFNDSSAAIIADTPNGNVVLEYAGEADLDECADFDLTVRLSNQEALKILTSNADYSARFVFSFIGEGDGCHPMTFEAKDVVMSDSTVNNETVLAAKAKLTPEQLLNIGLGHYDVALNILDSAERTVLSSDKHPVAVEWREGYLEDIDYSKIAPIDEEFLKQQEEELEAMKAQYEAWQKEHGEPEDPVEADDTYSGPDYSNWMKKLEDDVQVNTLSLPGTHDSGTKDAKFAIFGTQVQRLTIPDQFKAGVRVFDLRPGFCWYKSTGKLLVMHGPFWCHIGFQEAVKQIQDCLEEHPTEFAIVIVSGNDNKKATADNIMVEESELYRNDAVKMRYVRYFRSQITVGKMRGRMMFLNRDMFKPGIPGTFPLGGYVEKWGGDDGKIYALSLSHDKQTVKPSGNAELRCQDKYELLGQADSLSKIKAIEDRIEKHSARVKENPHLTEWSINHNSCYYMEYGPSSGPMATIINPNILEYIEKTHPLSTGIMMIDFAGCIFNKNYGPRRTTDEHTRIVGAIINRNFN